MEEKVNKELFKPIEQDFINQSGLSIESFQKECSFAVQHMQKTPLLQKATQSSVLKSVLNIAQVGLTLSPVKKEAFLVPRYNKDIKKFECVLEPSYIGLMKLLTDSGIKKIEAQVIYQGDYIEANMSGDEKIQVHTPYFLTGKEKGNTLGVYSIAVLQDGIKHCEMMSYADVLEIRERSESYKAYVAKKIKSCIWITDESEMIRKTVIKRHYKYLPKSFISEKLEKAIELDNMVNGFDRPVDFSTVTLIEGLINNSVLSDNEKTALEEEIIELETHSQAMKMVNYLNDNQPVLGLESYPVNEGDVAKAVTGAIQREELKEKTK